MSLGSDDLAHLFDDVMRDPESEHGINVAETGRLLAERVKDVGSPGAYQKAMQEVESIYLDRFVHTCAADPTFAKSVRTGIARYI
jgi:hypothetical protein